MANENTILFKSGNKSGIEVKNGLSLKQSKSEKGIANGYCDLDADNDVPIIHLKKATSASIQDDLLGNGVINKSLSANQGYILNQNKINISDIVNDLISTATNKPLSAYQGKILNDNLTTIMSILNSNDVNLDTIQEIINYIKSEQTLIDTLSTSKINVSDIIDNLTSAITNKPASANSVYTLKGLIDAINTTLSNKVDKVTGKGLSTLDVTQTMLDDKRNVSDSYTKTEIDNLVGGISGKYLGEPFYLMGDFQPASASFPAICLSIAEKTDATYSINASNVCTITLNSHGYVVGQYVTLNFITVSSGTTFPSTKAYLITAVTTNTFNVTTSGVVSITGNCNIPGLDKTISTTNYSSSFINLLRGISYKEGKSQDNTFIISASSQASGYTTITLANNQKNINMILDLAEEGQYDNSVRMGTIDTIDYKNWNMYITINGTDYRIGDLTNSSSSINTATRQIIIYGTPTITANTTTCNIYQYRNSSITSATIRRVKDDSVIKSGLGFRSRGKFQGHFQQLGYSGSVGQTGTNLDRYGSGSMQNSGIGSPITDGANGTPRTGNDTTSTGLQALMYLYAGTYTP